MKFTWIGLALACSAVVRPSVSAAQARTTVCDLVSNTDAAAVLGVEAPKQSSLGPDQCVFTVKGLSLMVGRLANQEPEAIKGIVELPKQRAREADIVKDERGIGDAATSELSKGHVAIFAADGDTVWTFQVQHVYSKDLSETLPRLRDLAMKIVNGKAP